MAIFKCKMCGGALEIQNNETVVECEYCGAQQTLPKLDDETRQRLQKVMEDPIKCSAFALNFYGQIDSDDENPSSVGFHMARAILNNNIEDFLIAVVGCSSKSLLDLVFSSTDKN